MADMPDRDTVDAVVLYDAAITLLAKADMYPDRLVVQVVAWLRERTRCSNDEDYAHACELAALIERMHNDDATEHVARLERVAVAARRVIETEDVGGECYEPFLRDLEMALGALKPPARPVEVEVENAFDTLVAQGVDDSWQK